MALEKLAEVTPNLESDIRITEITGEDGREKPEDEDEEEGEEEHGSY